MAAYRHQIAGRPASWAGWCEDEGGLPFHGVSLFAQPVSLRVRPQGRPPGTMTLAEVTGLEVSQLKPSSTVRTQDAASPGLCEEGGPRVHLTPRAPRACRPWLWTFSCLSGPSRLVRLPARRSRPAVPQPRSPGC